MTERRIAGLRKRALGKRQKREAGGRVVGTCADDTESTPEMSRSRKHSRLWIEELTTGHIHSAASENLKRDMSSR